MRRVPKTSKILIATTVAAFLSTAAASFAQDDASQSLTQAETQLKSGKINEALAAVRKTLSADPNNKSAHQLLGQIYVKAGANPNDVNSRLLTADTLYKQGRLKEAEVEYQASLCVKVTPHAYVGLGKIAERLKGPGEGKIEFDRALEVDSNCAAAHAELGKYFLMTSDMVRANEELTKALSVDPGDKEAAQTMVKLWQEQVVAVPNANSHLGLARAYQIAGDLPRSQAEYKEVVRLDPKHPSLPAARESFKIAIAKTRAADDFTQAKTLAGSGRLAEAYHFIADAVAYCPNNCDYKLLQGELLEKLAQPAQARQIYMAILDVDPQNQQAVDRLKNLAAMATVSAGQVLTPVAPPNMVPGAAPTQDANVPNAASGDMQVGTLGSFLGLLRNQMMGQGKEMESQMSGRAPIAAPLAANGTAAAVSTAVKAATAVPADASINAEDFLRKMVAPVPLNRPLSSQTASKVARKAPVKTSSIAQKAKSPVDAAALAKRVQMLEKQNKALQEEMARATENSSAEDAEGTAIIEDKSMAGGLFTGAKPMPHQ